MIAKESAKVSAWCNTVPPSTILKGGTVMLVFIHTYVLTVCHSVCSCCVFLLLVKCNCKCRRTLRWFKMQGWCTGPSQITSLNTAQTSAGMTFFPVSAATSCELPYSVLMPCRPQCMAVNKQCWADPLCVTLRDLPKMQKVA